ncbi:MAG: putative DNA binding domain-containing protein [Burkholderiaceae bacterium]|jgi:ATP-dependent DNA helicase RecG|nr:putative DNA binding domain-containing protein [Burkholderiaceae bacterium]
MISLQDADAKLTEDVLSWALPRSESLRLETKRVSGKMVGKALETVCAFANTEGGWLLLGLEDASRAKGRDRLFGIGESPEAVDEMLRKLGTHHLPVIEDVRGFRLHTAMRDGAAGVVVALHVLPSDKVHSILDDGTWMRGQTSNREMNAAEITELSYRRGVRSAESEPVDISFDLLDTETWRLFLRARGLAPAGIADQLYRIGLAKKVADELRPLRAAVLLFADYPGALLAGMGTRADVRVFHYKGYADSNRRSSKSQENTQDAVRACVPPDRTNTCLCDGRTRAGADAGEVGLQHNTSLSGTGRQRGDHQCRDSPRLSYES